MNAKKLFIGALAIAALGLQLPKNTSRASIPDISIRLLRLLKISIFMSTKDGWMPIR